MATPSRRQARIASDNAAAARSAARAAEATAQAEAAKAESARAAAALAETNRKAAGDAAARDPLVMATKLVTNAGGPVIGMIAGAKIAKGIEERHKKHLTAAAREMRPLADQATKILSKGGKLSAVDKARLASISKTAGRLRLGRAGPMGFGYAAVLAAEGAYTRFVLAEQVDNPAAKEAVRATGNAFAFAATSLLAKRAIARATAPKIASGAGLAAIDTARRIATTPLVRGAVAVGKFAGRAVPAIAAGVAAYGAYKGYQQAGWKGAAVGALTGGYVPRAMISGEGRVSSARLALARGAAVRTAVASRPTAPGRAAVSRVAATVRRSDGTTAGYTRRSGVTVTPYPTPKRRR